MNYEVEKNFKLRDDTGIVLDEFQLPEPGSHTFGKDMEVNFGPPPPFWAKPQVLYPMVVTVITAFLALILP